MSKIDNEWVDGVTGGLYSLGAYLYWNPVEDSNRIVLDGEFTPEELESIVKYIKEKK